MNFAEVSPATWRHALAIFGDDKKAQRWLATPLSELDDRTPEQVIALDPDAVETILDCIEYGVFA